MIIPLKPFVDVSPYPIERGVVPLVMSRLYTHSPPVHPVTLGPSADMSAKIKSVVPLKTSVTSEHTGPDPVVLTATPTVPLAGTVFALIGIW